MKVLVKLGGTLLDEANTRQNLAAQIADLARIAEVVAVHGGGKQVTKYLDERGMPSRFVRGLRVSDESVIDAVVKVIAGTVNKQFVSTLIAQGRPALGLSGIDGGLTQAVQLSPELGQVGEPRHSHGRLLNLLLQAGFTPVIACIAGGSKGEIFNVNADRMAVSCAVGWGADLLLFLTDVPGVKDSSGEVIAHLTPESGSELIRSGVAQGGMQAKLEAAALALQSGVEEVVIAPGREADICRRSVLQEDIGTRLCREVRA